MHSQDEMQPDYKTDVMYLPVFLCGLLRIFIPVFILLYAIALRIQRPYLNQKYCSIYLFARNGIKLYPGCYAFAQMSI